LETHSDASPPTKAPTPPTKAPSSPKKAEKSDLAKWAEEGHFSELLAAANREGVNRKAEILELEDEDIAALASKAKLKLLPRRRFIKATEALRIAQAAESTAAGDGASDASGKRDDAGGRKDESRQKTLQMHTRDEQEADWELGSNEDGRDGGFFDEEMTDESLPEWEEGWDKSNGVEEKEGDEEGPKANSGGAGGDGETEDADEESGGDDENEEAKDDSDENDEDASAKSETSRSGDEQNPEAGHAESEGGRESSDDGSGSGNVAPGDSGARVFDPPSVVEVGMEKPEQSEGKEDETEVASTPSGMAKGSERSSDGSTVRSLPDIPIFH
jgi:hypothetical protein